MMPKKLTARQRANRLNRKKWKGFTTEGLDRLRDAARYHQPWNGSTGPRTCKGKRTSSANAYKHGAYADTHLPAEVLRFIQALELAEAGGPVPDAGLAGLAVAFFFGAPTLFGLMRGVALTIRYNGLLRSRADIVSSRATVGPD